MICSPEKILTLKENEIFVFGSNYGGRHGKGAALTALKKFGAIMGQGTGLQGKSYGIATKDKNLKVLTIAQIETQIQRFLRFALDHPHLVFLVTEIGCGLAGFKAKEICPLFFTGKVTPYNVRNVRLPRTFWDIVEGK
jgi:hypothetical protein